MIEPLIGNNREWLGLIIPLWTVLFYLSYMSVFPLYYDTDENNFNPRLKRVIDSCFEYGGRVTVLLTMILMPAILLGFTTGLYQSHTSNKTKRWVGHVVGVLNVVLIYGIYRYYVPNS